MQTNGTPCETSLTSERKGPPRFTRLWWERYSPCLVAMLVMVGVASCLVVWDFSNCPIAVPAATMTFGVVVAGFTATQRNMLLTMGGSRILRFASTTGYDRHTIDYFDQSIRAGILVVVVSIIAIFLIHYAKPMWTWLPVLCGAIALAGSTIYRNECVMKQVVLRFLAEQRPTR